jgi:hypothetical protein
MRLTRQEPIDFAAIAEDTGVRSGTICHSPTFGWIVRNQRYEGPDIACIKPPPFQGNECFLKVDDQNWCFYEVTT